MPWAVLNVHRASNTPAIPLAQFLHPDTRRRLELPDEDMPLPIGYGPNGKLLPGWFMTKTGPAREAPYGARPPSSRPRGAPDDVIERFDAFSVRVSAGGRMVH